MSFAEEITQPPETMELVQFERTKSMILQPPQAEQSRAIPKRRLAPVCRDFCRTKPFPTPFGGAVATGGRPREAACYVPGTFGDFVSTYLG